MTEQVSNEEKVTIEELVVNHAYEMIALVTVLEKKGILSRQEIIDEIRNIRG